MKSLHLGCKLAAPRLESSLRLLSSSDKVHFVPTSGSTTSITTGGAVTRGCRFSRDGAKRSHVKIGGTSQAGSGQNVRRVTLTLDLDCNCGFLDFGEIVDRRFLFDTSEQRAHLNTADGTVRPRA